MDDKISISIKSLIQIVKNQQEMIDCLIDKTESLEKQVGILNDRLEIKIKQDNLRE